MADRTVPVTVPDWVWGRLATIAEHRGCSVGALIAEGINGVLARDPNRLDELRMELRKVPSKDPRTKGKAA
jgi:predicted DNA-binding ribbon-helix-helix protein